METRILKILADIADDKELVTIRDYTQETEDVTEKPFECDPSNDRKAQSDSDRDPQLDSNFGEKFDVED